MYGKLSIRDICKGHFDSFRGVNKRITPKDKREFLIYPILISFILSIWNIPDNSIKNVLAVCLSVLIGLLLNVLVLILSNIESNKYKLTLPQREYRLDLIKETFYNISFSVIISVFALVVLFLMDILYVNNKGIIGLFYILIELDINIVVQFLLSLILYFLSIQIFLILFMIIKRIGKIFACDIDFELKKKIDDQEKEE